MDIKNTDQRTAADQRIIAQLDDEISRANTYGTLAIIFFMLWIITFAAFMYHATIGTWS